LSDELKVTVEEPGSVTRKITVEVPAPEVDRHFRETFSRYRRDLRLPGFRRGKVPKDVIERLHLNDVTQDVLRRVVPESYERALGQVGLKPVSDPNVGDLHVERGQALVYTAEFEIRPSFEPRDYLGVEIENPETEVKEEEVETILEEMRRGQATLVKVEEDRGLQTEDIAMIDFEGRVEGEPIPEGSGQDFALVIGNNTFPPGFDDSLIGAKAGEEREFFIKLPEDFRAAELAGKEAVFSTRVKEIRTHVLPALDDDFARDVGEYKNLEELKERLRDNLRRSKEIAAKNDIKDKLLDKLIEANPFEVPPSMVQRRRESLAGNVERNLSLRGMPQEEIEKSRERIYQDVAAAAERKVKASLILGEVAEREKVEVTEEDLLAEIRKIGEANKMDPGEVRRRMVENNTLDGMKAILREEKTLDFLVEKAKLA
jgi:trigger factor